MNLRIEKIPVWLFFALLVTALAITRYADFDLWWHLKLGQSLVESGSLFRLDTFSWTFAGREQFTGEWLADLIIWCSYSLGGMTGIVVLKALVLFATLTFLYQALRLRCRGEQSGFVAAMLTLVLVLFALRFRMFVRPYIFSQLFMALYLLMLVRSENRDSKRSLYALLPLQVVWTNLSVGAIFGPALFFLYATGSPAARKEWRRSALLLAAIICCSLLGPETWKIYSLAFDLSVDPFKHVIGEYQSLTPEILWGFGIRYTLQFQILAVGALAWFVICRGWQNMFHLLLFAFFMVETAMQVRMIELSSLVAALFFAPAVERLLERLPARFCQGRAAPAGLALMALILIPASIVGNTTYAFGTAIKEDTFPDGAVRFLDKVKVSGKMFNSYSLGGYLLWRAPGRKVFIDGRYRRLYNPDFYRVYEQAIGSAAGWQALEERYPVDYAVFEYDMKAQLFPLHLNSNPQWALVYWDNHSAVYLKRTALNQRVIEQYEYRIAKPGFYDFSYLGKLAASNQATLLEQINRDVALNPDNQEPRLARAFLMYNLPGTDRKALLAEIMALQRLKPDLAFKHSALAMLQYDSGDMASARSETLKALALDPYDQGSRYLGKQLGLPIKDVPKSASPHH